MTFGIFEWRPGSSGSRKRKALPRIPRQRFCSCSLELITPHRKHDRERRAATNLTVDRHVAAHRSCEVATDRESESGPGLCARQFSVDLHERLEDRGETIR